MTRDPCHPLSIPCLNTQVDNPFAGIITDPNSDLSADAVLLAVAATLPAIHQGRHGAFADCQFHLSSLQLVAEKRYSNGLQFLATYAWSKSIDDSSSADDNIRGWAAFRSLQDPNRPDLERSLSTFDIPHVIQVSYSYDLPIGRGRAFLGNMPRWAGIPHWRMEDERRLAHC